MNTFTLNPKLKRAALDYVGAILEACEKLKISDTLDAIINTDAYPRLQKATMVEFSIGWLHGVAASIGIPTEDLWLCCVDAIQPKKKGRAA